MSRARANSGSSGSVSSAPRLLHAGEPSELSLTTATTYHSSHSARPQLRAAYLHDSSSMGLAPRQPRADRPPSHQELSPSISPRLGVGDRAGTGAAAAMSQTRLDKLRFEPAVRFALIEPAPAVVHVVRGVFHVGMACFAAFFLGTAARREGHYLERVAGNTYPSGSGVSTLLQLRFWVLLAAVVLWGVSATADIAQVAAKRVSINYAPWSLGVLIVRDHMFYVVFTCAAVQCFLGLTYVIRTTVCVSFAFVLPFAVRNSRTRTLQRDSVLVVQLGPGAAARVAFCPCQWRAAVRSVCDTPPLKVCGCVLSRTRCCHGGGLTGSHSCVPYRSGAHLLVPTAMLMALACLFVYFAATIIYGSVSGVRQCPQCRDVHRGCAALLASFVALTCRVLSFVQTWVYSGQSTWPVYTYVVFLALGVGAYSLSRGLTLLGLAVMNCCRVRSAVRSGRVEWKRDINYKGTACVIEAGCRCAALPCVADGSRCVFGDTTTGGGTSGSSMCGCQALGRTRRCEIPAGTAIL